MVLSGIKPLKAMACEDRVGPLLESEIRDLNRAKQKQVLSLGAVRALVEPLFVVSSRRERIPRFCHSACSTRNPNSADDHLLAGAPAWWSAAIPLSGIGQV